MQKYSTTPHSFRKGENLLSIVLNYAPLFLRKMPAFNILSPSSAQHPSIQ